jgi:hypothetical protein
MGTCSCFCPFGDTAHARQFLRWECQEIVPQESYQNKDRVGRQPGPPAVRDSLRAPPPPGLLARLRDAHFPRPQEMFITRSCFVCMFRAQWIDPHLAAYWDGTHQFHRNAPRAA